jgi:hypothetical protein
VQIQTVDAAQLELLRQRLADWVHPVSEDEHGRATGS